MTPAKSLEPEFSAEEIQAINQLRQRLIKNSVALDTDKLNMDHYLLQWLRAKDLDIIKAEAMLLASLKWRQENNFEHILEEIVPGDYYTNYPYYLDGEDRDGRTIISYSCGYWDLPKLVANGERDNMYRYAIQMFARCEQSVKMCHKESKGQGGKIVPYETVWVVDIKGSSIMKLLMCLKSVQLILELTGSFEKNFPEMVSSAYFINAPSAFSLIFKLMKPFMTGRTIANTQVYGSDENKWKPGVFSNIEPDQLRPVFGGTKGQDIVEFRN